ncbi:MAG TPA: oligosaccharide flippase family protein [Myxococcales bacterium]|nr:oligosaccharide flippase family protein [Myxococcales bacterium]
MNLVVDQLRAFLTRLFGRSGPLVASRVTSFVLGFALPLVLVRLLEPAQYGAYKQFFLVGQTILFTGQMGMTQSLFYFVPRGGPRRGVYVAHTFLVLSSLGFLLGAGLWLLAPYLAGWLGSPDLGTLGLPLALYGGGMLAAAPLEGALISDGRVNGAAFAFTCSDALRTLSMVLAAKLWGGHWVFWAAAAVACLRVAALWMLVARRAVPFQRPQRAALRAQLGFALPFAGATLLFIAQRYFSQYAVSVSFEPAIFALFTIASFHLPVVDIVFTPISEVLMVELGKPGVRADRAASLRYWHEAMDRLASFLFPSAVGAWLLGGITLPLLFTHRYQGAVPLFRIATLEILLAVLPVDALLRAAGETRFLFAFNFVRLIATVGCVLLGVHFFGLAGALAGGLISESAARAIMLLRGRHFFGGPLRDLFDWPALARIAGAAAAAALPTLLLRFALRPGLWFVLASAGVYGAAYLGARWLFARANRRRLGPVAAGPPPSVAAATGS